MCPPEGKIENLALLYNKKVELSNKQLCTWEAVIMVTELFKSLHLCFLYHVIKNAFLFYITVALYFPSDLHS